mmetsp:Transcript_14965/g.24767  ORF Transcript_14965/g.24767 Transcript_14965/m.24767 type:complete len:165 (-) Transcript_14965:213-707(-)
MTENQRSVYVLYGSQTGNSECIAKDLNEKLQELDNFSAQTMPLNEAVGINLKEQARAVIIVCSTTGNGDAPDNAEKFWRTIKKRALAKDTFEGVNYTVLGLGDTNYDKFCHMGKSLDKRFNELGGKRFLDLHCADEATGLEEVVEEWNESVVGSLQELLESDDA